MPFPTVVLVLQEGKLPNSLSVLPFRSSLLTSVLLQGPACSSLRLGHVPSSNWRTSLQLQPPSKQKWRTDKRTPTSRPSHGHKSHTTISLVSPLKFQEGSIGIIILQMRRLRLEEVSHLPRRKKWSRLLLLLHCSMPGHSMSHHSQVTPALHPSFTPLDHEQSLREKLQLRGAELRLQLPLARSLPPMCFIEFALWGLVGWAEAKQETNFCQLFLLLP